MVWNGIYSDNFFQLYDSMVKKSIPFDDTVCGLSNLGIN